MAVTITNLVSQVTKLQDAQTATNTGDWFPLNIGSDALGFVATLTGTGALTATVILDGSVDGSTSVPARATFSLSGTGSDAAEWETISKLPYWRARVTAISGTSAAVTVSAVGTTKQQ